MNKAKLIEGLNETISGLTAVRDALSEGGETTTAVTTPAKAPKKTSAAPATKTDVAPGTKGKFDPDQLNSMPYNEFKKLAAQLGVSCKGTRDEIMTRVMALDITFDEKGEANVDAPAETTAAPATEGKKLGGKKTSKTTAPAAPEAGEQKSDKSAGGKRGLVKKAVRPAPDEFDAKAKEIAGDTSVEDIIAALSDVGVEATADDYLTKLAAALREGKLEVDDEGDEGEGDADPEAEQDAEDGDITAESYFSEYDPEGFNDPANMSDERREAITAKMDEILTDYSEGNLAPQDVQDYLTEKATQDELDLLGDDPSDDEMLKAYMELVKRTIDNDGTEHTDEGDPYEVGDVNMCCAHPLKHVRKTGKWVCEMCGQEYEADE